jgi:hypothetical protein
LSHDTPAKPVACIKHYKGLNTNIPKGVTNLSYLKTLILYLQFIVYLLSFSSFISISKKLALRARSKLRGFAVVMPLTQAVKRDLFKIAFPLIQVHLFEKCSSKYFLYSDRGIAVVSTVSN